MSKYLAMISLLLAVNVFSFVEEFSFINGEKAILSMDTQPKLYGFETIKVESKSAAEIREVKLYHPGIDHFSLNPEVVQTSEGTTLNKVFFIKDGLWEVQLFDESKSLLGVVKVNVSKIQPERSTRTNAVLSGDTYKGLEFYNGKSTGESCYVVIERLSTNPKGLHCYDIKWRYMSNRLDVAQGVLNVSSRITNYHRREYPELKTCAMSTDGTTDGDDIYGNNVEFLVNDIFNGELKQNGIEFHTFLSLDKSSKELTRSRIHGLTWKKEWDVDCKGLKLVE